MKHHKRGFTLTEMLVVLAIISILCLIGVVAINKDIESSRKSTVESELRIFNGEIETLLANKGKLTISASGNWTDADKAKAIDYLNSMSSDYCKFNLDMNHINYFYGGFSVDVNTLVDPWKTKYKIIVNTDDSSDTAGTIILVSAGPNRIFSTNTYKEGKFGDDMLVTIVPNI